MTPKVYMPLGDLKALEAGKTCQRSGAALTVYSRPSRIPCLIKNGLGLIALVAWTGFVLSVAAVVDGGIWP